MHQCHEIVHSPSSGKRRLKMFIKEERGDVDGDGTEMKWRWRERWNREEDGEIWREWNLKGWRKGKAAAAMILQFCLSYD
ncbi:hypothetical protein C1H46_005499 [Malus baccata]|uniref:Uncharacterized protein n=1 Tax=Malus baccata TaxID=106549 RepID=A0A540NCV9_MALBA|nr:hypothetical protein C1H46_005499 [Malus baccata]